MLRQLAVFAMVLVLLGGAAQACGGPLQDVAPGSPEAQATSVRRTAVAEVQRIIANNPTATQVPSPTATAHPTCRNAIWWTEARAYLGKSRTIQGTIVATRPARDGAAMLEIGQPYPDPTGMAVLVSSLTAENLIGKTVCVVGRIEAIEGIPTISLRDASTLVVIEPKP